MGDLDKTVSWDRRDKIESVLASGGLVIYQPHGCEYSVGCSIRFRESILRIYQIKRKSSNDPLCIDFGSIEQLLEYSQVNGEHAALIGRYLESRGETYTFIVGRGSKIMPTLNEGRDQIIARINGPPVLKKILLNVGPLASTSANISGSPTPRKMRHLESAFIDSVDLVVRGVDLPHGLHRRQISCSDAELSWFKQT